MHFTNALDLGKVSWNGRYNDNKQSTAWTYIQAGRRLKWRLKDWGTNGRTHRHTDLLSLSYRYYMQWIWRKNNTHEVWYNQSGSSCCLYTILSTYTYVYFIQVYSTTKLHDHVHGIMECKRQKYSLPEKKSRENIGQIFGPPPLPPAPLIVSSFNCWQNQENNINTAEYLHLH